MSFAADLRKGSNGSAQWLGSRLSRPRTRLAVIGALLLIAGAWLVDSSIWTVPLIVVGAVMLVVAYLSGRLEGRFAVEWGGRGAEIQFHARVKAEQPRMAAATVAPRADVESTAHTVEIDTAELKALIAAAEAAERAQAARQATTQTGAPAAATQGAAPHQSSADQPSGSVVTAVPTGGTMPDNIDDA